MRDTALMEAVTEPANDYFRRTRYLAEELDQLGHDIKQAAGHFRMGTLTRDFQMVETASDELAVFLGQARDLHAAAGRQIGIHRGTTNGNR